MIELEVYFNEGSGKEDSFVGKLLIQKNKANL